MSNYWGCTVPKHMDKFNFKLAPTIGCYLIEQLQAIDLPLTLIIINQKHTNV